MYIAPGHGHKTIGYKFCHFKAFIIPIILYQFQKDPFCLIILCVILFYYIIHVDIAPGQEETTLRDPFFLREAERSYHFDHFKK